MQGWKPLTLTLTLGLGLGLGCGAVSALTFDEALQRSGQAPELAMSAAEVAAAHESRRAAGSLPDPRLQLSLDDFAIEGEGRYRLRDSKRMLSLMRDIPATARREAQIRQAEAIAAASEREREFVRLTVRRETSLAWIRLYFLEKKQAMLIQQADELRRRQESATAMLAGGGEAGDALEALIDEQAFRDAFDILTRDIRLARADLARWIGAFPATDTASGDLPSWLDNAPFPEKQADETGAETLVELRASQARIRVAQAELAMAEASKSPDWSVEFGIGQDAMGNAMAMAKVGISLPFFTPSRQEPEIAAARRMLEKSDAEHVMRRAEFLRRQVELEAGEQAVNARLQRLEHEILPLLARKIALGEAALSAGRGSAVALIEAREKRLAAIADGIDLAAERAAFRVRLHYLHHHEEDILDE
ncbi:MAG: TolC family protein [Azoarcus sp.]|jgi:outer membrane protein TolC|nr:TolC family protein [Azoarcus sp.]